MSYSLIPEHMMVSMNLYVKERKPMGGFLTAIFANDLQKSIARADADNLKLISSYVSYIYWELPSECCGSYEKVNKWLEKEETHE